MQFNFIFPQRCGFERCRHQEANSSLAWSFQIDPDPGFPDVIVFGQNAKLLGPKPGGAEQVALSHA